MESCGSLRPVVLGVIFRVSSANGRPFTEDFVDGSRKASGIESFRVFFAAWRSLEELIVRFGVLMVRSFELTAVQQAGVSKRRKTT